MTYPQFLTPDVLLLLLFFLAFFLHTIFIKKTRLFTDIVVVYAGFGIAVAFPYILQSTGIQLPSYPWIRVLLFLGAAAGLHVLLSHSNIRVFSNAVTPNHVFVSLGYRFAIVGLFLTALIRFAKIVDTEQAGFVTTFFVHPIAILFWLALPFFFAFAYRFRTGNGEWVE